jgi:dTDP-4-dehydrorhamnose 3,5-epimerase
VKFTETSIPGAYLIELEPHRDERGWFARTYDATEFADHGLEPTGVHCNASYNRRAGTLRGMHYQAEPHGEPKLVRCVRGAVFDVIVDIRSGSPAVRHWYGVELTPDNGRMLHIPSGVAHGFQTLLDASEVLYQMGHEYVPSHARGVRWDDPAFAIDWPPAAERVISERDASYPDFEG